MKIRMIVLALAMCALAVTVSAADKPQFWRQEA
jgi:hypothetical protein